MPGSIFGYLKSRADVFPLLWSLGEGAPLPFLGHVGTLLGCDASLPLTGQNRSPLSIPHPQAVLPQSVMVSAGAGRYCS